MVVTLNNPAYSQSLLTTVGLKQTNEEADSASDMLRVSMDAKATVKVGPFARGGKSRVRTLAADHDGYRQRQK